MLYRNDQILGLVPLVLFAWAATLPFAQISYSLRFFSTLSPFFQRRHGFPVSHLTFLYC